MYIYIYVSATQRPQFINNSRLKDLYVVVVVVVVNCVSVGGIYWPESVQSLGDSGENYDHTWEDSMRRRVLRRFFSLQGVPLPFALSAGYRMSGSTLVRYRFR